MQLLEPASGKAHLCLLLHKPGILCSVLQLLPPTSNHIPSDLSGLTAVGQCWMNQAVLHKAFYLPLFVLCFYLNKKLKCPDMKENILPDLKGIFSSFFFFGQMEKAKISFLFSSKSIFFQFLGLANEPENPLRAPLWFGEQGTHRCCSGKQSAQARREGNIQGSSLLTIFLEDKA